MAKKMIAKKMIATSILISIIVIFTSGISYAVTVKEVGSEIKMVGCEMLVSVCRTDAAQEMREKISGMIDKGMTKEEIVDTFIKQYGEQVYAAPTKEGFNLIAWIMPFLVIIIGGIFIYYITNKWQIAYEANGNSDQELQISSEEQEEYEEKLNDEFKKYL
ncbi:cytochrome c-type biogenesis protein [Selenihalanaerobacter shriftii]|uniref:Cytochrome c-type biogenesis protein n=1 Tax=Selenihalanaerobacter shriftii TaxID=142842 RepID=A0A1T4MTI8_9FIRM|nr:cytochrome c-type biogenesis protein CcmH [Selenihalanaerobacter shriftii]SJZ70420.1 cytochrome c-type biogenesis protein CcmH [Selenihalanaerobacter shriftii]